MSRPFIPAPNCASVELIYQDTGEVMENVLHVRKGSPYSLADLQAVRAIFNTWDSTTWAPLRAAAATLYRIRSKALDSTSAPAEDFYLPTPRPGTGSGGQATLGTAFCLKMATGLAGRSQRGRLFMANIPGSQVVDPGHVGLAFANNSVAAIASLISALTTGGHTLVVVSYMTGGAWRTTAQATPIINAVATDLNLDSQRRRLPGRGHTI